MPGIHLLLKQERSTAWTCVLALFISLQLHLAPCSEAAIAVSLELQGDCSDQLTLICRHSDIGMAPVWIHNGTEESGQLLATAFPGAVYTVVARTEHTATITGTDNVRALDGHVIQCVYEDLGTLIKSNAVKYSFIPPDYQPALSLVSFTANFSERLCTFTYSFQESCSLYPRCTPYFSVEHTVSPQSVVSNTSSGCSVEYTILNLMRCRSYHSTATALLGNQRGNTVVVGDTVMLSPGQFTITSVSIGADNDLINVTYMQYEPDCPGYPTEWYTVDIDGVQVADMTADEFQSRITNHTNDSVTLFLPLTQRLPENATTVNMTKFNTVPTNMSDDMGNIVTEIVTWGTSAVFGLQASQESLSTLDNDGVAIAASVSAVTVVLGGGSTVVIVVIVIFVKKKQGSRKGFVLMPAKLRSKVPADTSPGGHDETPTLHDHEWAKGAGRPLPLPPEEEEGGGVPQDGQPQDMEAGRAQRSPQYAQYAQLDFTERGPDPAPWSEMFVVEYAVVRKA